MINKSLLKHLLKSYDISEIENHLIYNYLISNKIAFKKSAILKQYFSSFEENHQLLLDLSLLQISTVKELEHYLELIIPDNDRKLNGAFFTPDFIIDFIIKEIKPKEKDTNLDPSCGCGAFLVGLTDYYKQTYKKPIRKIIKDNIFGSDILEYNIRRTKLILTIYGLQFGEYLQENDFNLYIQDSLKTKWQKTFDNIVGNPPYVKFQDLTIENREYLAKNWTTVEGGTFNLYFAFFELGYTLLRPKGKLGYITPNNYFTSLSGESIRKYFQNKKCISRIVDFAHKKVFDAQTYTAITFLNKQENDFIIYDRIKKGFTPESFLSIANGSPNFLKDLKAKKWRLLKTEEQKIIKTIETIGFPLCKLFDICVGIATLKDDVFFIDESNAQGKYFIKTTEKGTFKIEKKITKAVYKISDFRTQEEIEQNKRRIICPYIIKHKTAVPIQEEEFKINYPECYAYLMSERDTLLSRDKGKINFDPFYVWGRTQGLTRTGKRLLTPTFSQKPRFLLVEDKDAYFTNGYGIFFKSMNTDFDLFNETLNPITSVENIDVVQKILNSYLMEYYINTTSVAIEGGYPCYQKNFIEKFSIPLFSNSEIETLRSLEDKSEIDEFLCKKYHLNFPVPNLSS